MTKQELILQLVEMKEQVTKLGFEFIQTKLPIKMADFSIEAAPFIAIEKAFKKQIDKLSKQQ